MEVKNGIKFKNTIQSINYFGKFVYKNRELKSEGKEKLSIFEGEIYEGNEKNIIKLLN